MRNQLQCDAALHDWLACRLPGSHLAGNDITKISDAKALENLLSILAN